MDDLHRAVAVEAGLRQQAQRRLVVVAAGAQGHGPRAAIRAVVAVVHVQMADQTRQVLRGHLRPFQQPHRVQQVPQHRAAVVADALHHGAHRRRRAPAVVGLHQDGHRTRLRLVHHRPVAVRHVVDDQQQVARGVLSPEGAHVRRAQVAGQLDVAAQVLDLSGALGGVGRRHPRAGRHAAELQPFPGEPVARGAALGRRHRRLYPCGMIPLHAGLQSPIAVALHGRRDRVERPVRADARHGCQMHHGRILSHSGRGTSRELHGNHR